MSDQQVPSVRIPAPLPDGVSPATIGVRGGLLRSGFEETAEAMYLTSGYVYESAAAAEQAFTGEIDRYVYSRYGNPTISMFEERLRLIEGAPACFATATGMAAVFTSLGALLGAGDRLVAARSLFGSCFVVCNEILPRWGVETVFVDGEDLDLGLRLRLAGWDSGVAPAACQCAWRRWPAAWRSSRSPVPPYDFAIVDPPREGLGADFAEIARALGVMGVRRLLAVGCDPDAWARDLSRFTNNF